ncbi:MAG TPA: GAF domain-containing protein [Gaiellaceae bacterium]|nr:GAF domain-containing protein [Gaiellaceae bacterium]
MDERIADAERLRRLQRLTDAALAHLDLDELLNALLLRVREALAVDTCAVLLVDDQDQELVTRAAAGIEEEVERGVRVPVGRGFAGRIAQERRPVVLDDVDHSDVLSPVLRRKRIRSMLGVPLVVGDRVLGVLHVGSLAPRSFGDDDVDLLQLAADRAAIAIEHARLYDAERRVRRQLEHVQQVTDAALAHLELDELFDELLGRIRGILAADTCAVLLLDEECDELVARAALGIEEEVEQGVRVPLGRGFAGRVAATREPVVIEDVATFGVWNRILIDKGITSMLGVPLIARGRVIGVMHVGSLTRRLFDREDIDLLQLVAERVALAIEKARLHEELVQLDQLKLNFVAIASHELRTPATSVYGVLSTLDARGDELPAETRRQLIRVGHEQGLRLRRLLEQLLDLSRLDAAAIQVDPKPLVLRQAIAEIAASAVPGGTPLQLDVAPDLAVVADRLVLERVLSNLLQNATRYGSPPIVVAAEQRDRSVRIAVEDAGGGIPEPMRARLFQRFERGEEGRGSGLGLAIARAYARAHGGDLVYAPAGGGARFELVVPQG